MDDSLRSANHCLDIGTNIKQCQLTFQQVSTCPSLCLSPDLWVCVCEGFGALIECVGADVGLQSAASPDPLCGSCCSCQQSHTRTHTPVVFNETNNESNYLTGGVLYIDFVTGTLGLRVCRVSVFQFCSFEFKSNMYRVK